jgi:transcriptional regulator with XRE-family HTH domain
MQSADNINKKIADNIKSERMKRGWTLQYLAAICNIEKSNLSRIESGRTNHTVLTLQRICKAMGISIEEIFKA